MLNVGVLSLLISQAAVEVSGVLKGFHDYSDS